MADIDLHSICASPIEISKEGGKIIVSAKLDPASFRCLFYDL